MSKMLNMQGLIGPIWLEALIAFELGAVIVWTALMGGEYQTLHNLLASLSQ
jgi:hypothetical protein